LRQRPFDAVAVGCDVFAGNVGFTGDQVGSSHPFHRDSGPAEKLSVQRERQRDPSQPRRHVRPMLILYDLEMVPQPIAYAVGQHHAPILLSLAPPDQ